MEPDSIPTDSSNTFLADHSGEKLLRLWKLGDERAAAVLMDRYLLRLVALVASRLNHRFRGQVDPEDVVQSAMGSFFHAARKSRIQVSDSVSLWRLLATFARRKMAREIEKQSAVKRGGDHSRVAMEAATRVWANEDSAEMEESARDLIDSIAVNLPSQQRAVLDRLLAGLSQREIAASLKIDRRTVRRRLVQMRESIGSDVSSNDPVRNEPFTSPTLPRIDYREFVLGKLIGAGGFGKVYKASMQADAAIVAVKFLRKGYWQHAEARETFLREIDAASRVRHRNIVRYLGWGQSPQGGPYVLSEWIDGGTLDRYRTASSERFIDFLRQICEALATLHRAGVVHGDLTPANILVTRDDQVVLTDFGFSHSRHGDGCEPDEINQAESPLGGTLGGTLGFAAPEQVAPAFGRVGPKTDLYAVGGLAYWYLTGHPPHAEATSDSSLSSTIASSDIDTAGLPSEPNSIATIKQVAVTTLRKSLSQRPETAAVIEKLLARV